MASLLKVQKGEMVDLEKWRAEFYKMHTGDNQDTKRTAFRRARETLTNTKVVIVENDIYSIPSVRPTIWSDTDKMIDDARSWNPVS